MLAVPTPPVATTHLLALRLVRATSLVAITSSLVNLLVGANINRNTVKNVQSCAYAWVRVDGRCGDIIKLIEARK
jgi:hypothetical protein